MPEVHAMNVIAHIRTQFPSKFGIPGKRSWWRNCGDLWSLNRNTAIPTPCAGWRIFPTSG